MDRAFTQLSGAKIPPLLKLSNYFTTPPDTRDIEPGHPDSHRRDAPVDNGLPQQSSQSPDMFKVKLNMADFEPSNVQVQLRGNCLHVLAKKSDSDLMSSVERDHYYEYTVPVDIALDSVKAYFDQKSGFLTLEASKVGNQTGLSIDRKGRHELFIGKKAAHEQLDLEEKKHSKEEKPKKVGPKHKEPPFEPKGPEPKIPVPGEDDFPNDNVDPTKIRQR